MASVVSNHDNADLDTSSYHTDDKQALQTITVEAKPFWKQHIHEMLMFTFFFGFTMAINVTSNLFLDRACLINLNRTLNECYGNDILLNQVQVIANNYSLAHKLVQYLPSLVLGFFIGPWSDKYGKKPPMYIALICSVISAAGMVLYVFYENLPLYVVLVIAIPIGFSGAPVSFVSCLYAIVTESTPSEKRTIKFNLLELGLSFSIPISSLIAAFLFDRHGYKPVFILSLVSNTIPLVITFFLKDESERREADWIAKLRDFFSLENFKENIRTVTKRRERKGRTQIILLTIGMVFILISHYGKKS